MKDLPKSRNDRQRRFRAEMNKNGWVQTQVWVPAERKHEIRQIAEKMRENPDIRWTEEFD